MAQVYLTKIERKTIFTKSLIYVAIMFLAADLTVTGPFWFNFIPWLYLLGIVGSIKGIDKVLTCIIGGFTVLISSIIYQGGFNLECITSVIIALVQLVSGVVTGYCIYQFILEHRLVKYIKPSNKATIIVIISLCTVLSFGLVGIFQGNLVTYLKSKSNLKNYIYSTYNISDYKINKVIFSKKIAGNYSYVVNIQDEKVYFMPITKTLFKDVNKQDRLELLNEKLENNTSKKIEGILDNLNVIKTAKVNLIYQYTKVGIAPDSIILRIIVSVDKEKYDKAYLEMVTIINEVIESFNIDGCEISMNDVTLNITKENLQDISVKYLKGGFEIEELDELGG